MSKVSLVGGKYTFKENAVRIFVDEKWFYVDTVADKFKCLPNSLPKQEVSRVNASYPSSCFFALLGHRQVTGTVRLVFIHLLRGRLQRTTLSIDLQEQSTKFQSMLTQIGLKRRNKLQITS